MRRWTRLAIVAATGVILVAGLAGGQIARAPIDPWSLLVGPLFYGVAAFLVIRVPDNRVSWLLLAIALGFGLTGFAWMDSETSTVLNFGGLFVFLLPGVGVLLPIWFPTGEPPSRRWRWVETVGWGSAVVFASSIVIGLVAGNFNDDIDGCYSASSCLEVTAVVAMLAATPFAVASLISRWATARGTERQQLKLMALALGVFAVAVVLEFSGGQGIPLVEALLSFGAMCIPVALAITISAYRLYDIDRIISRTVSYALVVVLLAGGVAGVATLAGTRFSQPLIVAATTLGVAATFNPLRRRVQTWVDRRFNRSRYDAERVIDQFAGSMRERVDPDGVVDGWVGVVSDTMQPSSVGVWVRSREHWS